MALAALALQFALSFGHVHCDGVRSAYHNVAVAGSSAQKVQPAPAQQPGDDNDYCAICATIYLAATTFVPQAPQLPVPFISRPIEHFDRVAAAFITPRRAPFQSRAPPRA